MNEQSLENWIKSIDYFASEYKKVKIRNALLNFPCIVPPQIQPLDWTYLLNAATALSRFESEESQTISLRIAQQALRDQDATLGHRYTAALLLDSKSNRLAIKLAQKRDLLPKNIEENFNIQQHLEWTKNTVEFSIADEDGEKLFLNRFQMKVWEAIQNCNWVSISAPTSSGKSFLLTKWIKYISKTNHEIEIAILVPTRALVTQTEQDLRSLLNDDEIFISSIPQAATGHSKRVWVFTQERMHIFLQTVKGVKFDAIIVDEAHKIGDTERGVLLQQVIESSSNLGEQSKLIFASPLTKNPELLLADAPLTRSSKKIPSDDAVVNQSIIWVSQIPRKPRQWKAEHLEGKSKLELGIFELPQKPRTQSQTLPTVAHALSGKSFGNLIYANTPSQAEKMAATISTLETSAPHLLKFEEISELISYCIHPEFSLIESIRKGVAFHYGDIPLPVKIATENLFKKNEIRFLIATSTLVEGVNISCKNVFIMSPKKGKNSMSSQDFWNLAGRAGRWGHEFEGNVICVNPQKWNPPQTRSKYTIKRSSDRLLKEAKELTSYIKNEMPAKKSKEHPEIDHVISLLISNAIDHGSIEKSPLSKRVPTKEIAPLDAAIKNIIESSEIPSSVIQKNPGININAMKTLLSFFNNKDKNYEELIPPKPDTPNAANRYAEIFTIVGSCIGLGFEHEGRCLPLAITVTDWMCGKSIPSMIESKRRYMERNNRKYKIRNLIRETMSDINQVARFKAPKALSVYSDLLDVFFKKNNMTTFSKRIEDYRIMLELGVSTKTQVSLISLGLDRSTSIGISAKIPSKNLTTKEAKDWLKANIKDLDGVPRIMQREIKKQFSK